MAIKFACECGKKLQARDDLGGRKMKCPTCQRVLTIPHDLEGEAAARHGVSNGPAARAHEAGSPVAASKAPFPPRQTPRSTAPAHVPEPQPVRPISSRPAPAPD